MLRLSNVCRPHAVVNVYFPEGSGMNVASAALECWTSDGTAHGMLPVEPPPKLDLKEFTPIKDNSRDRYGHDFSIGDTGMRKLQIGIDAEQHKLYHHRRIRRR